MRAHSTLPCTIHEGLAVYDAAMNEKSRWTASLFHSKNDWPFGDVLPCVLLQRSSKARPRRARKRKPRVMRSDLTQPDLREKHKQAQTSIKLQTRQSHTLLCPRKAAPFKNPYLMCEDKCTGSRAAHPKATRLRRRHWAEGGLPSRTTILRTLESRKKVRVG